MLNMICKSCLGRAHQDFSSSSFSIPLGDATDPVEPFVCVTHSSPSCVFL